MVEVSYYEEEDRNICDHCGEDLDKVGNCSCEKCPNCGNLFGYDCFCTDAEILAAGTRRKGRKPPVSGKHIHQLHKQNTKGATTVAVTEKVKIPAEMQLKVDEHLDLYAQYKALEKKLKVTKAGIKEFMDLNDIDEIEGTNGGKVTNKPVNQAVMSAEYTSYDVEGVKPFLDELKPKERKEILVTRVDRTKLEAYVALNRLAQEVLLYKKVNPEYQFRTYQGKK